MKKVLISVCILLICAVLFGAEHINAPQSVGHSGMDIIVIDDYYNINDFTTINGGKLSSTNKITKFSKRSLLWEYKIDKYRNSVVGWTKENINLPVPNKIEFYFYPSAMAKSYPGIPAEYKLYIGIMDSKGNRVVTFPYFGVENSTWNKITLIPSQMKPFAVGAKPIEDIKSIFIGTQDCAAENFKGGKRSAYFSPITFYYDYGKGIPQKYTAEEIDTLHKTVKTKKDEAQKKLNDLNAKGLSCRYELMAVTVADKFLDFSLKEKDNNRLNRAYEQLSSVNKLMDKTIKSLDAISKDNSKHIEYKDINPYNITVKNGILYDGDRPVFLAGVNGWYSIDEYKTAHDLGYNWLEPEFMMFLKDNKAEIDYVKTRIDEMGKNNICASLLLSPHYIDAETYEKYPSIDPEGVRRKCNFFMGFNVESKEFKDYLSDYINKIVNTVKDCPNLIGYDLVNEVFRDMAPDFDYNKFQNSPYSEMNPWIGQSEFTKFETHEFLDWMNKEIKKYDTKHITSTKIIGFGEVMGTDAETVGNILDAHGIDQLNHYCDSESGFIVQLWEQSINLDAFRSFDSDKVIVDGEYHVIPFDQPNMPGTVMNLCMWNNYVRGKDMNDAWVWGRDIENDQNPLFCQPDAVYALSKSILDVNRVAEYVVPFAKQKGEFALYYGGSDFENLYIGANFNDTNFDFVTNKQLEKAPKDYKVIFILDDAVISDKAKENLNKSGKVVIVKSEKGYRDYYNLIKAEIVKANCDKIADINKFGIECRSYEMNGNVYYYIFNYTRKNIKVNLPKESRELITGKTYKSVDVEPAGVYLLVY